MRLTVISHSSVIDTNQQLFAELAKLGVAIQLIVPARWRGDLHGRLQPPQILPGSGLDPTPVPVLLPGNVPLHVYRASLGRLLYLFQPDAVYVENESYAASTFQAAIANQLSVRKPLLFRNNQNLLKPLPAPFRNMERYVFDHASCANVVNQEAGTVLRAKGYKGRVAYLPYGVDVDFYHPHDARALREQLGLRGMVFGYMGRLVEEKGVMDLVEAFGRFHPEEEVSLLVIGKGPLEQRIAERFRTPAFAGRATLLPVVEHREVPRYLSAMATLVVPSRTMPGWKEQFGRVIIEAMACGVPVIGSSSGEIPHLIERLEGGLVVPEGDVAALHGAMRRLLEVPGKHDGLRERGRREVEDQYANSALAYRFSQLLTAVVRDGKREDPEDMLPDWA